jgi:LCP family protein required for cell wall assembly
VESQIEPRRGPQPPRRSRTDQRRERRRAHGLAGTLGLTLLGALLPGSVLVWSGRRVLGALVLLASIGVVATGIWYVGADLHAVAELLSDPRQLRVLAAGAVLVVFLWALVVAGTYAAIRARSGGTAGRVVGVLFVGVLVAALAAPVVVGARYSLVQADLVHHVFQDNQSATAPTIAPRGPDPWGGKRRVNILLLGGDGGIDREGVRTDSMILASINTRTGATTTFSLPRNLMHAQFPASSPLHDLYPDGFRGAGDDGNWMLNAVYREVPLLHPGVLGRSDNEGADAIKQAVSGTLGIPVDYYLLANLDGFEKIVDAMGGVTVNINEPVAVGGNKDRGILPDYYLQPGPHQHLDGFKALWFSRGRFGANDYHRMERQRCMVDALIRRAKPATLVLRYQRLAAAGKEILRTDVPSTQLPALVDLAMKVKQHQVRSVVFTPSANFFSGDPDFDWIHGVVRKALTPPRTPSTTPASPSTPSPGTPTPTETPADGEATTAQDVCAYHPVEG